MTTTPLVYLDTETTGLDARVHDTIEAAWAVEDGPINEIVFPHTLEFANPDALRINGYLERGLDAVRKATPGHIRELVRDLTGATLVAENYGFDVGFLMRKLGFEPWHHRKIELSSVAMTIFDLDRPESMRNTAARLRDMGHDIPEGDHTAAGDVACLRACHQALITERAAWSIAVTA